MKKLVHNRIILPLFTLFTCLFLTYLFWNIAVTSRKNELHTYLEYRSRDVYNRIEQRILNYEQVLRNARGLFDALDNVNRREFSTFYSSLHLDKNYPGIQGVGFSLLIPANQIKEHTDGIRNEGFPEYKIWPEGNRKTYTSIIYLEPFKERNLRAFGYDMFSEPVRRKAMQTALDSNKTTISGKVNLVQETGNEVQAGFLIYLPVYKNGTSNLTISERRKNIIGWVYSPFRMGDFMEGLFGERAADIDVEIYDGNSITNETKMYDSQQLVNNLDKTLLTKKEIYFNGNEWTVLVKYTPQLELRIGHSTANIIAIVGISLSILFTIITWLLVNKKIYAIKVDAERRLAESYLKKLQEEQQILLDNIPAWVFYKDTENRFIRVNKSFANVMGMPVDQLEGKSLFDIFPKEQAEAFWNDDKEVFTSGKPKVNIIESMEFPKGNIWVQTDKVLYIDTQGKIVGVIGFALEITDRKLAEEELKKSHEQLIKLNATKDKFFSIIAHDLRSPFVGFLGLTELMADKAENLSPAEFLEYSKSLNEAAKNLFKLLENLLEWSQIQNGSIKFAPKDFDLSELVSKSIATIYQRALNKKIAITNEISISQIVYADNKMIGTLIRNLLSNAVKFTRSDGEVIVKSKHLDNDTIVVSVKDNGVGMPESDVKRLFKIEEKVSSIGTDGEPSTGLGLLLCKDFIEMHGGKIWAESEENIGSTFYFTLKGRNGNDTK